MCCQAKWFSCWQLDMYFVKFATSYSPSQTAFLSRTLSFRNQLSSCPHDILHVVYQCWAVLSFQANLGSSIPVMQIGGITQAAGDLLPDEVDLQAPSPLRFDKCNFLMALQYEVWYCSGQKSRLNGNIRGGGLFDIFEHRQPSGIFLLGGLLKGVHLMSCKCLYNSFSSTASAGIGDIAAARQSQDSSLILTSEAVSFLCSGFKNVNMNILVLVLDPSPSSFFTEILEFAPNSSSFTLKPENHSCIRIYSFWDH